MRTAKRKGRAGAIFLLGAAIGAMIGAAVTILMAPQSGPETQAQIRATGRAWRDELEQMLEEGRTEVEGKIEEARHGMADMLSKGSAYLDEKRAVLEEV